MLSVIMLIPAHYYCYAEVIILSVVMLNVFMLGVVMLNVVAPFF